MTTDNLDAAWALAIKERAIGGLRELEAWLNRNAPDLIVRVGSSANGSFPFRGWLSIFRQAQGDELALCVDVFRNGDLLCITGDLCTQHGTVLDEMAAWEVRHTDAVDRNGIEAWTNQFLGLLLSNRERMIELGRKLA